MGGNMGKFESGKKKQENNLDERQEQKLLHIEKNAFWILYFLIALDLIGKRIFGAELKEIFTEALCFMAAGVYLVAGCVKNGIWDRRLQANRRTNLAVSAVAAVFVAIIVTGALFYKRMDGRVPWMAVFFSGGISGIVTFLITFSVLSACSFFYHRRVRRLEDETEDTED